MSLHIINNGGVAPVTAKTHFILFNDGIADVGNLKSGHTTGTQVKANS